MSGLCNAAAAFNNAQVKLVTEVHIAQLFFDNHRGYRCVSGHQCDALRSAHCGWFCKFTCDLIQAKAEGDLRVLNSERDHTAKEQLKGVTAVTSAGGVIGILSGKEDEKLQALSGDDIKQLDAKMSEIKIPCGLKPEYGPISRGARDTQFDLSSSVRHAGLKPVM